MLSPARAGQHAVQVEAWLCHSLQQPGPRHAQWPPELTAKCVRVDGMTSEPSEADSDALARSAHAEQDEALRQANRAKAQAQQQQQESAKALAEQAVTVQEGRAEAGGAGQPGSAPQPPVSPFTRATVHRQIGNAGF